MKKVKCLVAGCNNHTGEGRFVGDLCGPCHTMITTGQISFGETFIHRMHSLMQLYYGALLRITGVDTDTTTAATQKHIALETIRRGSL